MIHPDSPEWREYMAQAVNAQAGPYDIFSREAFAEAMRRIPAPHEPHPVTDGMEEE